MTDDPSRPPVPPAPAPAPPGPARSGSSAASRRRTGKRLIVAGFVITVAGVVLYSAVSLAGVLHAGTSDVLRDATMLARTTLALLAVGALFWLAGSLVYLRGAIDPDPAEENRPAP